MSLSKIQPILDRLPFHYENADAVNAVFQRWRAHSNEADKQLVETWAYAYIYMFFIQKRTSNQLESVSAVSEGIQDALLSVLEKKNTVRNPDRFAHWVSVVCRNAFLNLVRDTPEHTSIDATPMQLKEDTSDRPSIDSELIADVVHDAIDQLPNYLQVPARLYFLEGRSFQSISEEVDKSVATVRVYKQRAMQRLQQNEILSELNDFSS